MAKSSTPTRVAVIAVGDELLSGFVVNTNAAWLGRRLAEVGCEVVVSSAIGDSEDDIVTSITESWAHADAVIVTGGLGPTSDDRTRTALARVAGVSLERDPESEQVLRSRLDARHRPITEAQLSMVAIPKGAMSMPNSAGTAPGIRLVVEGKPLYAVPGPPAEMRAVVEASVLADLQRRSQSVLTTRSIRTALVPESDVAALLEPVEAKHPHVKVAYVASPAEVVVRLTVAGKDAKAVGTLVDDAAEDVRELLGDSVVGDADKSLAHALVSLLTMSGRTVAVAESITGGGVAHALTDVPGSSQAFRGAVVAYATDLKETLLGVDGQLLTEQGSVHAGVARMMATGVRTQLGADFGIATTGVAGPEPHDGQEVGTVHIAVAGPSSSVVVSPTLYGDRDRIRQQAVVHALDLLRRFALGLPPRAGESSD